MPIKNFDAPSLISEVPEESADNLSEKLVIELLSVVAPDTEKVVRNTVKQTNALIREHIRAETGLRLQDQNRHHTVPVTVSDGLPTPLSKLITNQFQQALWKLAALQRRLPEVIHCLNDIIQSWDTLIMCGFRYDNPSATTYLRLAVNLCQKLYSFQPPHYIENAFRQIQKDVLGTYSYKSFLDTEKSEPGSVTIYWMAIGLVAHLLGVKAEDLTVVTLIHELAHAYTHAGCDHDGFAWPNHAFSNSDLSVIEGLAQFYTALITKKLALRFPLAHQAYEKLLFYQPPPYHFHTYWGSGPRIRETVRYTLLQARRLPSISCSEWLRIMEETEKKLEQKTFSVYHPHK
ncbi:MAG: hypothetical protein N2110_03615 [Flavobacteriales bacterium]|nr:hypothetical protein [Flavobacteriales bacterium]MCX7768097.1 hypothetical protein [Flavobacteriales bacterium]MDW8409610.1 hypothetical protein [Flavobacteriales bacterium]